MVVDSTLTGSPSSPGLNETASIGPRTDEIAVAVRHVSKMYPLYAQPSDRLKQSLWYALPRFLRGRPRQFYREFWALQNVSFEVKRGEALGIIGQNGSGKSTLLQIIAGTLAPTAGEVEVNGRVSALLELGSGFNPEFTGRENVYLNGAILGFSREEMEERFAPIVRFAQIDNFIDQPVKTYSSGMYIRLAFAVAVCTEPDILIVDEALSVGDALYQSRSYRRMEQMREAGSTIIFVTHDFYAVQSFCDRALLLDNGQILKIGAAKPVVNKYTQLIATREREYVQWLTSRNADLSTLEAEELKTAEINFTEQEMLTEEFRYGTRQAEIVDYYLLNQAGEQAVTWENGETGTVVLVVKFNATVKRPVIAFLINTPTGITVSGTNSWYSNNEPGLQEAGNVLKTEFCQRILLNPGEYVLSVGVSEKETDHILPLDRRYDVLSFTVTGSRLAAGIVNMESKIKYEQLNRYDRTL